MADAGQTPLTPKVILKSIAKIIKEAPDGIIKHSDVEARCVKAFALQAADLSKYINKLLELKRIKLLKAKSNELSYEYVSAQAREKLADMSSDENIVYEIIGTAKNKGM
eukprot:GABV01008035.1.p1 GENE.GABV01008035.1~~GABV01008035.1.p1  ORF type:complete len:128 (-),score=54.56 GABV01008035.1:39-365(-)